jgi:hypothetical protein
VIRNGSAEGAGIAFIVCYKVERGVRRRAINADKNLMHFRRRFAQMPSASHQLFLMKIYFVTSCMITEKY